MWFVVTETINHPCGGTIVEKGAVLYVEQVRALAREAGIDSLPCVVCLTPLAVASIEKELRV
jgi:hypothetical protein